MTYRGHVENGTVRLDNMPTLPEGAQVEVRLLTENSPTRETKKFRACTNG